MESNKTIFVVNEYWGLKAWLEEMGMPDNVSGINVTNLEYARKVFAQHGHEVDLVVICERERADEKNINTILFVKEVRQTFTGPMIAKSSNSTYTLQLMDAGCNYVAETDIAKQILKLLGI